MSRRPVISCRNGEALQRLTIANLWGDLPENRPLPQKSTKLLRSWLVLDSESPQTAGQTHKVLGLVVAFVFSATCWTGIGWMIASALK